MSPVLIDGFFLQSIWTATGRVSNWRAWVQGEAWKAMPPDVGHFPRLLIGFNSTGMGVFFIAFCLRQFFA
ncbi:hypothetical protein PSAC2689_60231 [Paraburkholderia sacchari]|uniref:hypothetical protein n=1 Tax=Paraburkholderia sacchari TaxID=159450 RepID=UPI0039A62C69